MTLPKEEWSFEKKDDYIRMLQIRDFTQQATTVPEYIKKSKTMKTCQSDDVLIARYGASLGKILTGLSGAYNVAIMKTTPDTSKLQKKYLFYYLTSQLFQGYILNVGSRAAQAGFNKNDLNDLLIPLPPLPEQRRIAAVLDKVSELIALRKKQLALLDEMVKARFVEMFGTICESEYKVLKDVCTLITDGTHNPPNFVDKGIPFLLVSNIRGNRITYDTHKFITEETYNQLIKRTPIEKGDVLLSTVGSYGHPAIVNSDKKFSFQRHIAQLKPNHKIINSVFLHSAILSPSVQRQIDSLVLGVAQKTLNLSAVKIINIPLPNISKQTQFADFVQQVEKSKATIQQGLEKLELLKSALMQEYFE